MPEVVAQSNLGTCPYTSGGGFSSYYPTPRYQLENVKNYLAIVNNPNDTSLRPVPGYNGAGRGYPDVAMQGYYYVTLSGEQLYLSSGTSASCPAMAGIISTLNAARMRTGKGAVGFLHPALYKHASKFVNDVVGGNNKCTQNSQICCTEGFHATPGWDPASGLGSINYGKMEAVFLALGQEANALTPFPSSTPTTAYPSISSRPTSNPTALPTTAPTLFPSMKPTSIPSFNPTVRPTLNPTPLPTATPTSLPSSKPTSVPSTAPTQAPAILAVKSATPSCVPTSLPSATPSGIPSVSPTAAPIVTPSLAPTSAPSARPSGIPSVSPTAAPTMTPSCVPPSLPSATPSVPFSSVKATYLPSRKPTSKLTKNPVIRPTRRPTRRPSLPPSEFPTSVPTSTTDDDYWTKWLPTSQLTNAPTDPASFGLHGNGQVDLPPRNSPTIKTSVSIRAIQVDITLLNVLGTLSQFIFTSHSSLSSPL